MPPRHPDTTGSPSIRHARGRRTGQALGFLVAIGFALGFPAAMATLQGRADLSPRQAAALVDTVRLREFLRAHYEEAGRRPRAQDGLGVLVPDFVASVPLDPWGRPYVARLGDTDAHPDALSLGEDGKAGGTAESTDISGRFGLVSEPATRWADPLALALPFGLLALATVAARRHAWGAGLLSGLGGTTSFLLLTVIAPAARFESTAAAALIVGLLCLTGSVAVLRRAPAARILTPAAVVLAYALLERLVAV